MRNMPPGRNARQWLRKRLDTTARAIGVLEQKTHALVRERRRLRHHFEETRGSWEQAMREADRWFLKAVVIGGRRQLDLARSRIVAADAQIRWRSLMGVTFPADVRVEAPQASGVADVARSSALACAAGAYRRAVESALDHAAAIRALELVEAELALTRRRLRGLDNHWVPRLTHKLHEVELSLAEEEREDMVRAKWVAESGDQRS
jgi:V/A-type H+-transporting ATPase subunit D